MGCDIHAHVELKLQDGRWHHWNAPHIDRHYRLFSLMAGVRQGHGSPEAITPPRGLPEDISELTRLDADGWIGNGHHYSWLNRTEIGMLQNWLESNAPHEFTYVFETEVMGGYLDGNGYVHELPEWVKDVRLVFWFDN
jgi:hypothetical protein